MSCVVHVTSSTRLDRGGPSISVTRLVESLQLEGVRCVLVCPDHSSDPLVHVQLGVPNYSSLREWFKREGGDTGALVHFHGIWDWHLHRNAWWCRRKGIRYIVSPHGMLEPWALQAKWLKKRVAWWLYQRRDLQGATLLMATATSEGEQFQRLGLRSPMVVYPNGVDIPERSVCTREDCGVRQALFLSRVHPKKGLLMLAEAWAKLQPQGWRMLVVGPDVGGHRREVEAVVRELGIEGDWEFRDSLYGEDKERMFLESDLFVLPTHSENFGIAVAEALAFGLPVLTTRGAPWEGVLERDCGWWVDATTQGVFSGLREGTQASDERRREMGLRGRAWMQEAFGWRGIAAGIRREYEKTGWRNDG